MSADENSLGVLVEEMNGDLRQILGFLQVWKKRGDNTFIYATFKDEAKRFGKDKAVTVSNFDAATLLMSSQERAKRSYKELLGLYFIDYDLVPLLVQENYLNAARPNSATGQFDIGSLRKMARAADSIARSDKMNLMVRRDQNWKLLDAVGFNSCLLPCHLIANGIPFAKFPEWFGKYSSEKKMSRELKELKVALMDTISGGQESIKMDYGPALLNLLRLHLVNATDQSLDHVMEIYENYGLSPELVKEHLVDVIYNPKKADMMNGIESKVKASFTRLYNSKFKESLVHKKKKITMEEIDAFNGEGEGEYEDDEDDEDSAESVEIEKPKVTKKQTLTKKSTKDIGKKESNQVNGGGKKTKK